MSGSVRLFYIFFDPAYFFSIFGNKKVGPFDLIFKKNVVGASPFVISSCVM